MVAIFFMIHANILYQLLFIRAIRIRKRPGLFTICYFVFTATSAVSFVASLYGLNNM